MKYLFRHGKRRSLRSYFTGISKTQSSKPGTFNTPPSSTSPNPLRKAALNAPNLARTAGLVSPADNIPQTSPAANRATNRSTRVPVTTPTARHYVTTARSASPASTSGTSVARSSAIMASGTLVSRILGMIRSPMLLTLLVGLNSPIANAFDVANALPNIAFNIVAGGLINAVLVPSIVQAEAKGEKAGNAFINKILTLAIAIMFSITAILLLCAPLIVQLFATTLSPAWFQVTLLFAYWCLPQLFFYGIYAVIGQILNARENFGPYMWAPVVNNLFAIASFLILLTIYGKPSLAQMQDPSLWASSRGILIAACSTLGIVLQALVLLYPLHKVGIRYRPDFSWRGHGIANAGKASSWVLLSTALDLLPLAILTNMGLGAMQRAIDADMDITKVPGNAAFSVGNMIAVLPVSIIAISLSVAIFTKISKAATRQDFAEIRSEATSTIRFLGFINFLAITLLIVLAYPAAHIFVPSGNVNEVASLAIIISLLTPMTIASSIIVVCNRVCYALNQSKGVFLMLLPVQLSFTIIYFCTSFLPPDKTVFALSFAYGIAPLFSATNLLWFIRKQIKGINGKILLTHYLKLLGIVSVLIPISWYVLWHLLALNVSNTFSAIFTILLSTPVIALAYLVLTWLAGVEEAKTLQSKIANLVKR